MSIARIIRAADCPRVAWKNGGGTTREIAVSPHGAGMDNFLWRLSMAEVEQAGPFSAFAGIDRTLAVLQGTLHLQGPTVDVLLDGQAAPFAFDGGAAVSGDPIDGGVIDLNAMTRRGAAVAHMIRLQRDGITADKGFLIAIEGQIIEDQHLDPFDCAEIDGAVVVQDHAIFVTFRVLS